MSSTDLQPSKLGTKEHWDGVYSSELSIFEDIGDEGEVWFGEDSVDKMVDWARDNVPTDPPPFILEVGAGNGNLLFALCEAGYASANICGVDYSSDAIKLAQAIAQSKSRSIPDGKARPALTDAKDITFAVCDFLTDEVAVLEGMQLEPTHSIVVWDLVLDKGTFDAIALAERGGDGAGPADKYPTRIGRVVKPGGHFLITSCNFTEDELKVKFANAETGLEYHSKISWPTFSFGGKSGNMYSSVAFHKPIRDSV